MSRSSTAFNSVSRSAGPTRRARRRSSKGSSGGDPSTERSRSRSPTCGSNTWWKPNDVPERAAVSPATAVRVARVAEGAYAIIAVVLAFGLPWPPRGQGIVLFSHWLGTALLAAAIALRLGRPNRQTWYVAAVLAGYVLLNAVVAIARMVGPESASIGRPATTALVIGAVLWVTQIVVAVCL